MSGNLASGRWQCKGVVYGWLLGCFKLSEMSDVGGRQ